MKFILIAFLFLFVGLLLGEVDNIFGFQVKPTELYCNNGTANSTNCNDNSTIYVNTSLVCTSNNGLCSSGGNSSFIAHNHSFITDNATARSYYNLTPVQQAGGFHSSPATNRSMHDVYYGNVSNPGVLAREHATIWDNFDFCGWDFCDGTPLDYDIGRTVVGDNGNNFFVDKIHGSQELVVNQYYNNSNIRVGWYDSTSLLQYLTGGSLVYNAPANPFQITTVLGLFVRATSAGVATVFKFDDSASRVYMSIMSGGGGGLGSGAVNFGSDVNYLSNGTFRASSGTSVNPSEAVFVKSWVTSANTDPRNINTTPKLNTSTQGHWRLESINFTTDRIFNMSNGTIVNATSCDTLDTNSDGMIVCGTDGGGGGNSSFNQSLTDTLYYPRNNNPNGYYNSTTLPPDASPQMWSNGTNGLEPNSSYSNNVVIPNGYVNVSRTGTAAYFDCGVGGANDVCLSVGYFGLADSVMYVENDGDIFTGNPSSKIADTADDNTFIGANMFSQVTKFDTSIKLKLKTSDQTSEANYTTMYVYNDSTNGEQLRLRYSNGTVVNVINNSNVGNPFNQNLNTNNNVTFNTINATESVYAYGGVEVVTTQSYFCDFLVTQSTTMCYPNYLGVAITSGTSASTTGNQTHPGTISISDATGANSGYSYLTSVSAFLLNGSEEFKSAFFLGVLPTFNNNTITRLGFLDTTAPQTEATDGVYCVIRDNATSTTLGCMTSSNSVRNATSTNITLNRNWYEIKIILNNRANTTNFQLYNASGLVYNQNLTNNIPTAVGRETGAGIVSGTTNAGTATVIFNMDYIMTEIETPRRVLV